MDFVSDVVKLVAKIMEIALFIKQITIIITIKIILFLNWIK